MNTIDNVWYLSSKNTILSKRVMAMDDTGTLSIFPNGLSFKGQHTNVFIKQIVSVSYGKQGRDFINNWVKVSYYGMDGELVTIYFADGNNRGWSGIFGGTRKMFNLLNAIFAS